jgi:MFS family permease
MSAAARSRLGLLAIGLAILAPAMDTSVNIAMPALTAAFGLGQRDIQWIVTCYMLVNGSLMLTCGKLGDLYGHRRILQTGLVLCAVAFVACALSPSYPLLLAGRALQGAGIALALSCAPALATALYPDSARTWVLGAFGTIFAFGGALGPLVGSWLVATFGWAGVFAFRVPLVLAALALSPILPGRTTNRVAASRAAAPFDWAGALLLVVWMSALTLAASGPHDLASRWPSLPTWMPDGTGLGWWLAATGIAGLVVFLWHEARFAEPIIRPAVFGLPRLAVLNAFSLLVNMASFAVLLIVPYFLVRGLSYSIELSGLILAICGAGTMAGSWVTGRLGGTIPPMRLALVGIALAAFGLLLAGQWESGQQPWFVAATLLVQGFGMGLFQVAYNDSVIAALPPQDRGVAGSLTMMVRTLGIIGGATGLSALFQHLVSRAGLAGADAEPAFRLAFQQTMTLTGAGLLTALALSLVRPRLWR